MRKIEILIVTIIFVVGTFFTFSLGNLIVMDHMAGILGVPFLFFLLILCLILIFSTSSKARKRTRIILALYLITLVSYSITMLMIRSKTDKVFEYVYRASAGDFCLSEKILSWYCGIGIVLTAIILLLINNREKNK